ncbi:hypothetical protein B0T20DRAFT_486994 [Sordaria brevicollis]|uniref:Heterokaryon incompatibility protein n=1 Tax=Sordaria brevicollis TaxID=83679 RepID=A0AAE0P916_SORBR|nr:hypothetical protein B0T20DRAFT_486994 [Sordaria brevicollis]
MAAALFNSHGGLYYSSKYPFLSIPFFNFNDLTLFTRGWVIGAENFPVGNALEKRLYTVAGEIDASRRSVWQNIVKDYSRLDLTFASDRLVAIAGMAAELGSIWDGGVQCYAGLWSLHFRSSLLWYSVNPSVREKDYIAPSWSWASVGKPIEWFDADDCDGLAEVLHVDVDLASPGHPFGPVTKGVIRLNGPLCQARLVKTKYGEILCFDYDTQDTNVAGPDPDMPEGGGDDVNIDPGFRTTIMLDHDPWSDALNKSADIIVYVAPLQTDINLKMTYSGLLRLGGLLLAPTTESSPGNRFRRVGHFSIQDLWGMEGKRVYEERVTKLRGEGKLQQKDEKPPSFASRQEWLMKDPFGNGVVADNSLRYRYTTVVNLGYEGEISRFLEYIERCAEERRKLGVRDPNLGEEDDEVGWYTYEIV